MAQRKIVMSELYLSAFEYNGISLFFTINLGIEWRLTLHGRSDIAKLGV